MYPGHLPLLRGAGVAPGCGDVFPGSSGGSVGTCCTTCCSPAAVVCVEQFGQPGPPDRHRLREVLGGGLHPHRPGQGSARWAVVWKHGFRTALLPVVTTILNHIPHIIGGSLVVERIFGWPGMGEPSLQLGVQPGLYGGDGGHRPHRLGGAGHGDPHGHRLPPGGPRGGAGEVASHEKRHTPSSGPFGPTAGRPPLLCSWGWKFWWCSSSPLFLGQDPQPHRPGSGFLGPSQQPAPAGDRRRGPGYLCPPPLWGRTSLLVGFASAALGAVLGNPPWVFGGV